MRRLWVSEGVSEDYTSTNARFNGVDRVQLDAGLDRHDHLITPEERFRVAAAIQSRPHREKATS